MRYLLVLILLLSCSTVDKDPFFYNVHPILRHHVVKFDRIYKKLCNQRIPLNVTIKLEPIPEYPVAGGMTDMVNNYIIINKQRYARKDHWLREEVVFHELGHLILRRMHTDEAVDFEECPRSMMYFMGAFGTCYQRHYKMYINELFEDCL